MNVVQFNQFMISCDKGSINETDIINNGGILVDQQLKKVAYNYNIEKMLNDIIE